MTGEDHDTDALIATLTSPALSSERVGEEAAVTAMLGAMSAVPAAPTGHRSRRGIAIAAVTVASLGVGGLVAAGPGVFFSPADDPTPSTIGPQRTPDSSTDDGNPADAPLTGTTLPGAQSAPSSLVATVGEPGTNLVDDPGAPADGCDAERHGDAVADVARSTVPGQAVSETARSDCGKPVASGGTSDNPSNTAPGRTGDNPSNTAPGQTGDNPGNTAPGQTGESPSDTTPGQAGDNPSDTAPGQAGESPSDTTPGQAGESPSDTAPGPAGGNPSDTAPGQAGGTGRP